MKIRIWSLILLLTMVLGCKKNISLPEFNDKIWKSDKGGCNNERLTLIGDFLKIKNKLKGHSSSEILSFMGKPDKEDLYSRNQKFYYYFLEPGVHCSHPHKVSESRRIVIRFNAMDRVTEVNHSK